MKLIFLHGAHQEFSIRAPGQTDMAACPFEQLRFLLGDFGVPEPGPAIGGHSQTASLWIKGDIGHRLIMLKNSGKIRISTVTNMQVLARTEGNQAGLRACSDRVDPSPGNFCKFEAGLFFGPDHPTVVAACKQSDAAGM